MPIQRPVEVPVRPFRNYDHAQEAARRINALRQWRICDLFLALAVLIICLVVCEGAAIGQARQVFSRSVSGEGPCSLAIPGGVAVDESSGDIYVVSRGNGRVVRFGHDGECLASFKVKVAEPEPGTVENASIAVDNSPGSPSFGDVYVVASGSEPEAIDKFEGDAKETAGKVEGRLASITKGEEEAFGVIHGVALDAAGSLYVYQEEGVVDVFGAKSPKNDFVGATELEGGCIESLSGFAVAPAGDSFYVAKELESRSESCVEPSRVIAQVSSSGGVLKRGLESEPSTGVAVALGGGEVGDVYVQDGKAVSTFSATGGFVGRFGEESGHELQEGAGVAVDAQTREVFVADARANAINVYEEPQERPAIDAASAEGVAGEPGSERLTAQIDPKGSDTHYVFQYGTADCGANPSACVDVPTEPGEDIGAGFGDHSVSAQLSSLGPGGDYFYRVIAANASGTSEGPTHTFETLPSPGVLPDGRAWELVSPADKGGASVEPISSEGGLIQAAAQGGAIAYIANAPFGSDTEGNRALEPNQILSTRTAAGWSSRDIATANERGEGFRAGAQREYQAFSPDLSLALVEPQPPFEAFEHPALSAQASERTIYRRDEGACLSAPERCFEPLVSGMSDTAEVAGEKTRFGGKLALEGASPDLGHAVLESKVALTNQTVLPSEQNLYEWSAGKPPSEQLQLVSVLPSGTPAQEASLGSLDKDVRNAVSADGSRVFWTGLAENERHEPSPHLFMRDSASGETVQVDAAQGVAEQPEEELEPQSQEFQTASVNGERVFFTYPFALTNESTLPKEAVFLGEGPDLYACELPQAAKQCKLKDLTVGLFGESADLLGVLGASEDGSYVYFVANGVLDPQALAAGAAPGTCAGEGKATETCSLYVDHYSSANQSWEEPQFIATVSGEDEHDWLAEDAGELARLSSRVSPDGRFLAFMSDRSLTGYDNRDINPEAHEARDEEVFLYDAQQDRLICASCNPSGARPQGVLDTRSSGEGLGLLVDRPETWAGRWLAGSIPGWTSISGVAAGFASRYQSRYLSDSGRLFFNAADPLVPEGMAGEKLTRTRQEEIAGHETQVGVENVYEYEPKGAGGCQKESCVGLISSGTSAHESAFLDASEDGEEVFFTTAERLIPSDQDTNYDVYDARVCTPSSPCLSYETPQSQPCEGLNGPNACRPAETPHESTPQPPATSTFSGPGNQVPGASPVGKTPPKKVVRLTRAQKLTRALKACKKKRNEKSRAVCERQARRQFAAKKPRKNPSASAIKGKRG